MYACHKLVMTKNIVYTNYCRMYAVAAYYSDLLHVLEQLRDAANVLEKTAIGDIDPAGEWATLIGEMSQHADRFEVAFIHLKYRVPLLLQYSVRICVNAMIMSQ